MMNRQVSIAALMDDVAQLDDKKLSTFVQKVSVLRAKRNAPVLSNKESNLFKKINQGFPDDKWQRLGFLDKKMEQDHLTQEEHEELITLIEEYERFSVLRLKYLGQLAILKGMTLGELMDQLGISHDMRPQ
jgi:hypothetical protein